MTLALSVSWNDTKPTRAVFALLLALTLVLPLGGMAPRAAGDLSSVIVRALPGQSSAAAERIEALGGVVTSQIGLIDGIVASVPRRALPELASSPVVASVTPNGRIRLLSVLDGFDSDADAGSLLNTNQIVGARNYWAAGYSGRGVDVALIDSGVAPVSGLLGAGKVLNGVDLSFEAELPGLRYLDTYGHGTHLAGIIAGRDDTITAVNKHTNVQTKFLGVAPDARIVNVKVAGHSGATDVSQVIAAIDWVVQHRQSAGLNIRVLNLSFGTDGVQAYALDPLAYAAEVAWRKGIVVVVAAGNSGYGTAKLNNPAYDPYVIAVGASSTLGTLTVADDTIPAWSSRGDGLRNPDLVAPGKSIVSLRVPGSYIDAQYPEGRVTDALFRGSGTSQAAAVVSGLAALITDRFPQATPDQVKRMLMMDARPLPAADPVAQGSGAAYLDRVMPWFDIPAATQSWPASTGLGSLELARGSVHVELGGSQLVGEQTVFGPLDPDWAGNSWSGNSWSGGGWSGNSWSGNSWSSGLWLGNSWSDSPWSGSSWSGNSWSGNSWSGSSWSGSSWSGSSWSGSSWSGSSWSGSSWSSAGWR